MVMAQDFSEQLGGWDWCGGAMREGGLKGGVHGCVIRKLEEGAFSAAIGVLVLGLGEVGSLFLGRISMST